MKKTALLLTLFLGFQASLPVLGHAVQRKHKPWFGHSRAKVEVDTPASVRESQETPAERPTAAAKGDAGTRVANRAIDYKGTRYRFGGDSKRGMDCSGLVSRVWDDLKMQKIPRASSALYQSGKPVHLAELRPGDLVFFKNTYRRGISHVGVYTGNNKFIHAANRSKGVTITKLSDPYYQLHYAGARRLY